MSSSLPDSRLPTHIIDCTDLANPRLVSTDGRSGKYLTLSYVWGLDQIHKTTASNVSQYECGIDLPLLPATIRDAIYVTHTLGFQFLWVDSLCIIQDSDEDKRHEIGRMHHIYRHSHLTIIAASAETVAQGFLHDRSPTPPMLMSDLSSGGDILLPFICPPDPPAHGEAHQLDDSPLKVGTLRITPKPYRIGRIYSEHHWPYSDSFGHLRTRGWCMQEDLLSSRALIFTPRTLQFRCLTATQNVGRSLCDTTRERRIPLILLRPSPPVVPHDSKEWERVYGAWLGIVDDYSRRTTSFPADKLPACAAIAEQFHRVLRSGYLAGLWRATLLFGLLWHEGWEGHLRRPDGYRAPSWSWAAIDGAISWDQERRSVASMSRNALAKIVRCEVTLEDVALPFGRVTGGTLALRAATFPCQVRPAMVAGSHEVLLQATDKLQTWRKKRGVGDADGDDTLEAGLPISGRTVIDGGGDGVEDEKQVWAIPLLQWGEGSLEGLVYVVTLAGSIGAEGEEHECGTGRYRRVGWFQLVGCLPLSSNDRNPGTEVYELVRALKSGEYPSTDIQLV